MKGLRDYRKEAEKNEAVFRNVLKDLRGNRDHRPMGSYVPGDLESDRSIQDIFRMYSEGDRYGRFTILDFSREGETARITFENKAFMSGGRAEIEYLVMQDDSVEFSGSLSTGKF